MNFGVGNDNTPIVVRVDNSAPSQLEQEYIEFYGKEFVDDLKFAFRLMKRDIRHQPPKEVILGLRTQHHEEGDRKTLFFIDFRQEKLVSLTIDEFGNKTNFVFEDPLLIVRAYEDDINVRYLLSGLCYYSMDKAKFWLNELLGPEGQVWYASS